MEINKIYNEHCIKTMRTMPDNFIDLTVTSPPYESLRTYDNNIQENWDDTVWEGVIEMLFKVTKKGGIVVWVVGDATTKGSESGTSFKQALYAMECGFRLHDTMIFSKKNPVPLTHNRYEQQFEYMFVFSKGKPKTFNPIRVPCKTAGNTYNLKEDKEYDEHAIRHYRDFIKTTKKERIRYNIWSYVVGTKQRSNNKHPAVFPKQLAVDHIKSWSNKNDLVYDPFMGSGTVAECCIELGRPYIGSEISQEYCEIIKERLSNVQFQMFP